MFARQERSPTPQKTNYDFALRHERVKVFHRIITQCDDYVARTSQAVREVVTSFSLVAQSYHEVSQCVNNTNPSSASLATTAHTDPTDAAAAPGRHRVPTRKAVAQEIGYQDGVVAHYGRGLQVAARGFVTESRALKDGPQFAAFNEGMHRTVLTQLREVQTAAKGALDSGSETEKRMKRFGALQKLVDRKERKYAQLGKPLTESKRYEKQVQRMREAEATYLATLESFDEKYEHLFQRELYVTGYTLDSFLDVNFTLLSFLMQLVGSLAPSGPETVEKVIVEGGEEMGEKLGIAPAERIGSKVRGRRAPATAAGGPTVHNFTTYYSTRREEQKAAPSGRKTIKTTAAAAATGANSDGDSVVNVDEAPPTARNHEPSTPAPAPVAVAAAAAKSPRARAQPAKAAKDTAAKPAAAAAATAAAAPRAAKRTTTTTTAAAAAAARRDEPDPRPPQQPQPTQPTAADATHTPPRAPSNVPFGDTPSHMRPSPQARPIVKRNPSRSPSREPFAGDDAAAAPLEFSPCSRLHPRPTGTSAAAAPVCKAKAQAAKPARHGAAAADGPTADRAAVAQALATQPPLRGEANPLTPPPRPVGRTPKPRAAAAPPVTATHVAKRSAPAPLPRPVASAPPPEEEEDDSRAPRVGATRTPTTHDERGHTTTAFAATADAGAAAAGAARTPLQPSPRPATWLQATPTVSNGSLSTSGGYEAETGGRPTMPAVPLNGLFVGMKDTADRSNGSLPSPGAELHGITPPANNISGRSTPPSPAVHAQTADAAGHDAPFYSDAWAEANLTKGQ